MRSLLLLMLITGATLVVGGCASIPPDILRRAEAMQVFGQDPPGYESLGMVSASESFIGETPDPNKVLWELKLEAARKGADAIANFQYTSYEYVGFTGAKYPALTGTAIAYRKLRP